jgi:hypothetical protein
VVIFYRLAGLLFYLIYSQQLKAMKQKTILTVLVFVIAGMLLSATNATAKIWRINNTVGINRDFAEVSAAAASSSVSPGDTLYVEPSATNYDNFTLTKRLVIIGGGYWLGAADGNPGLQYNTNNSRITYINVDTLASGSEFLGLLTTFYLYSDVDDIKISRCYVGLSNGTNRGGNTVINNLQVHGCYVTVSSVSYVLNNAQITNCVFNGANATPIFTNANNLLFRNNTVNKSNDAFRLTNAYITNNIFNGPSSATFVNCTLKNNLATGNFLPAGNNNVNNVVGSSLFIGGTSTDGQFQLSATSPARNAGETINSITPDCGAFGTAAPYRLSGIPPVPTIYALTVPASVPSSATNMNITISTRSNN